MNRKMWFVAIGILSCLVCSCGRKEIELEPEKFPPGNTAETYTIPTITETFDLFMVECQIVSVIDSRTILVSMGGEEKEIVLYGVLTPAGYEDQAMNHLQKIIPEAVCIDYVVEETGEAYVWKNNNTTFFSNCINYRICYDGYAVMNPAMEEENRPHYENAEEWAQGTESGLWANTGFEETVKEYLDEYSASGNNASESAASDIDASDTSVSEADNSEERE